MPRRFTALAVLFWTMSVGAATFDESLRAHFPATERVDGAVIHRNYLALRKDAATTEIIFDRGPASTRWLSLAGAGAPPQLDHLVLTLSASGKVAIHITIGTTRHFHYFPKVQADQISLHEGVVTLHRLRPSGEFETARVDRVEVHIDRRANAGAQSLALGSILLTALIAHPSPVWAGGAVAAGSAVLMGKSCARFFNAGIARPRLNLGAWTGPHALWPTE